MFLGIVTASNGDEHLGEHAWLWVCAAIVVPAVIVRVVHNRRVQPPK